MAGLRDAARALEGVLRFDAPADQILSRFLREHSRLGARERRFVAETVYGVLRHHHLLAAVMGRRDALTFAVAFRARFWGEPDEALGVTNIQTKQLIARVRSARVEDFPLPVRCELPEWVLERLVPLLGEEELLALGAALQRPASLDLRVNELRARREDVLATLAADGIAASATPFSPLGVRLEEHPAINRHPLFLQGKVEVQDEGSQLVGLLVAPRRGEMVVDFCAGAGGKTLLLGALMRSQGRLYAFEVSPVRLKQLKPRLQRSGLTNVHPALIASENDARAKRLAGKADRVLVDAPCTGLGTLRRNPDLKFRQSQAGLAELVVKQAAILEAAAGLVKPGGRLVYATCSLLQEENRGIVEPFLERHPEFRATPAGEVLARAGVALDCGTYLELAPHRHGTDGFFAAAMERSAG